MKSKVVGLILAYLFTSTAFADLISGDMQLRDAIYLYGQDLNAKGSKVLVGQDCDVFQLVLDVESGYTDISMSQSSGLSNALATQTAYPDRIYDSASMFAYAMYQNVAVKTFSFRDKNNLGSSAKIGTGTVFGYCYSTKANAFVYLQEKDKCLNKFSDGTTQAISSCTPVSDSGGSIIPLPSVPTDVYEAMLENELFMGYRHVGVDVTDGTQNSSSVGCGYADPLPSSRSSFESLLINYGATITSSTTTAICASMSGESSCSRLIGGSYALQAQGPSYSEIELYLPQLIAGHMTSIEYSSSNGVANMSSVQSDLSYSSGGSCAQQSITQPASAIDGVWRGYKTRYFPSLGTGSTITASLNCSNQLCSVTDSQGDTASIQFSQQSSNGVWKGPTGATTNARAVMSLDKQLLSLYVCPAPLVESSAIENCSFYTFIH